MTGCVLYITGIMTQICIDFFCFLLGYFQIFPCSPHPLYFQSHDQYTPKRGSAHAATSSSTSLFDALFFCYLKSSMQLLDLEGEVDEIYLVLGTTFSGFLIMTLCVGILLLFLSNQESKDRTGVCVVCCITILSFHSAVHISW